MTDDSSTDGTSTDDTSTDGTPAEALADGGAVASAGDGGGSDANPIERARAYADDERVVVAGIAIALIFLPTFLVDGLGALADAVGIGIGGYQGLASLVLIFGIAVVGYNLLLGYVGLLSFGHAAFFGMAAYGAALIASEAAVTVPGLGVTVTMPGIGSPIVMVAVGAIVATLLAWPIGFLSIRRSGVYFAVLTLTFGQMLYFFALAPGAWLTGGDNGFGTGESRFEVGQLLGQVHLEFPSPVPSANWIYVFVAVLTIVGVAIAYRIINSPYGLIFQALGENEERVEFVGFDVFRYKLMAFVISGHFAGIAGALFSIHEAYIHPNTALYWITSGDFVIMNVVGGVGTLVGPLFGALLFEYISNVISGITLPLIGGVGSLWRLILGATFVFIVWVFPDGLWGAIRSGLVRLVGAIERSAFGAPGDGARAGGDVEEPGRGGDD